MIVTGLLLMALADPCSNPPAGMRCAPAAAREVGEGKAKRTVEVERLFFDPKPVTAAEYARCASAEACAPAESAVVDWARAERYCAWAGKRLPTEAEWEVALAGAEEKGEPEWTASWFVRPSACRKPRADLEKASDGAWARALCGDVDRMNACDGAVHCGNLYRRVVKDPKKPKARKGVNAWKDKRQRAFRCVTTSSRLTHFVPPKAPPKPSALKPPTAQERAAFLKINEDKLDIPPCGEPGRSFLDCRDPRSYLKTNEPLLNVVLPYVKNLGGGYTGVGSDQSYNLVAEQRARWVWLFDYDENVVRWHHVLEALILAAEGPDDLLKLLDGKTFKAGKAAIAGRVSNKVERRNLQRLYRGAAPGLAPYFKRLRKRGWSWLGDADKYAYIRALYQQGRMRAFKGNMLDTGTMRSIGVAARALKIPIRVYYPSNAPEFWELTTAYRDNVRGLPFDDDSIVVQTISGLSMKTGFGQKGYWHYNVHHGLDQQRLLLRPGITRARQLLYHRVKSDSPELTLTGVPAE